MLKDWKDRIIEDQMRTIERLVQELGERMDYERKLVEIIRKLNGDTDESKIN